MLPSHKMLADLLWRRSASQTPITEVIVMVTESGVKNDNLVVAKALNWAVESRKERKRS